jgi:hypothetical protein
MAIAEMRMKNPPTLTDHEPHPLKQSTLSKRR